MVLSFVQTVDKRSWNLHRAALKKVWEEGLGVTWPLHARDLACAEYYEAKNAPPIKSVVSWAEAVEMVKDPWTKLMLLLFWQYGLRPSHLASFKWRNIERTAEGEPFAIFALERGFKKQSPVRAVLFPNVKRALLEWEKISPNTSPEAPLLCWRDAFGHLDGSRPTYPDQLRKHWINIQKDRELPVLQLNAPRHFVARTTDKAALSEVATNFLMGHKVTKDVSHRRDYRYEAVEVCLEEQLRVFPNGPLGWLSGVKVETAGLPKELLSLVAAFWQGQEAMTVMQFADQVDKLQRLEKQRQQKAEQQVEVPKLGL